MYNQCMNNRKTPSGFRLSEKAKLLLLALSQKLGISQTAVIEIAIRQMAETEHIELGKMNVREGIDETTITSKS